MTIENQHIEWKETWRDEHIKWIGGFANAQGGIEKIIDLCFSVGFPAPVFDTRFGGLQIEFVPNSGSEVIKTGVETGAEISEKVLTLIKNNPKITIKTLVDQTGKSHGAIERILKNLQKAKKILRVGYTKGGYWKIFE